MRIVTCRGRSLAAGIAGLLTALLAGGPLLAAQDVEELVVSVRKTEENIQEVPIQVTSLSEDIVRSEAIREIGDVARLTPSLQFDQGFWSSDTRVSIRGLFNRAGRPSAAVLIDGIDAISEAFESSGGSALLNQRLLDVERIEVARGPQSALYGRAAFSGAINYVTKRPPEEFEVTGSAQVADGGRFELRASAGGTLIDDVLTARVNGSHYELDGDYVNPNTGAKLGGGESNGIGVAFNWTPSEALSVYWNNTYSDDKFAPQPVVLVTADTFRIVANDGSTNGAFTPNGDPADCNTAGGDACLWAVTGKVKADESQIDISPDPKTGIDFPGTSDKTFRSNLIVDYAISDALDFRSATSVTSSKQRINFDSTQKFTTPTPAESFGSLSGNYADARNEFRFRQFYQEFQLNGEAGDSVNWLVGVNAFLENATDRNLSRFWYRPTGPFCFLGAPCSWAAAPQFDRTIRRETRSYSAFGLFGWQFAERWKLTLEGRFIHDEVDVEANSGDLGADALGNIPSFTYGNRPGFATDVSDDNFLPRVTVDFYPREGTLLYASVAKGIKPPTFNTTDLVGPDPVTGRSPNEVGREKLWTYELGTKNTLADGKLLLNGALFYNDYTDQQVRVQFPRPGGGIPTSGAVNAGEVSVWGVEVDASWLPTDRWLLNASYAYTRGEFDDFVLAEAQAITGVSLSRSEQAKAGNLLADQTGNDTPGTPEHAATLLARYTAPLRDEFEWFGQASVSYQGERWADTSNLVELESYFLANAQLGVQSEQISIALFVENLFDDDTVRYAQEFIDQSQGFQLSTFTYPVGYFAYLPQPRTLGLRLNVRTR